MIFRCNLRERFMEVLTFFNFYLVQGFFKERDVFGVRYASLEELAHWNKTIMFFYDLRTFYNTKITVAGMYMFLVVILIEIFNEIFVYPVV